MDKKTIIENLYQSSEVDRAIGKVCPRQFDEVKSEIFLILCEMPEDKLLQLYSVGYLKTYICRILLNITRDDHKTRQANRFGIAFEELEETHRNIPQDCPISEDYYKKIVQETEGLHWYDRELLNLYITCDNNCSQLSRETGIPRQSISRTISEIKSKLKKIHV